MKIYLFTILIVFFPLRGTIAISEDNLRLNEKLICTFSSYYLDFSKTISIDLSDDLLLTNGQEGKQWKISWSDSECEDFTDLLFDLEKFRALLAKKEKSIFGNLTHTEPDLELKTHVSCQLK